MQDLTQSLFHIGEPLLYSKECHNVFAKVSNIILDNNNKLHVWIVISSSEEIVMSKESLCNPDHPDIAFIPSTTLEINVAASHLSEEELQSIKNPVKLLSLQEE